MLTGLFRALIVTGMESNDIQLTSEQTAELMRLCGYFPYRVIWGAIHPVTREWQCSANATKARMNKLAREGWIVYDASFTK